MAERKKRLLMLVEDATGHTVEDDSMTEGSEAETDDESEETEAAE